MSGFCSAAARCIFGPTNGPEFIATALRAWYRVLAVAPLFIEPGSPWENGSVESSTGKLRDELLNWE